MTHLTQTDVELQAERDAVEKLFAVRKTKDTPRTRREEALRRIAASLFLSYFDAEERYEVLFGPTVVSDIVEEYVDKADKIYECCGDFDTSMKCLQFLRIADPECSRKIVERL